MSLPTLPYLVIFETGSGNFPDHRSRTILVEEPILFVRKVRENFERSSTDSKDSFYAFEGFLDRFEKSVDEFEGLLDAIEGFVDRLQG